MTEPEHLGVVTNHGLEKRFPVKLVEPDSQVHCEAQQT